MAAPESVEVDEEVDDFSQNTQDRQNQKPDRDIFDRPDCLPNPKENLFLLH
jgi:hypothetical protein